MGFYRAKIFQHPFLFRWKMGPPSSAQGSLKALGKPKLIHPFASGGKKGKSSKGAHLQWTRVSVDRNTEIRRGSEPKTPAWARVSSCKMPGGEHQRCPAAVPVCPSASSQHRKLLQAEQSCSSGTKIFQQLSAIKHALKS